MKPRSPHTNELIRQLKQPLGWRDKLGKPRNYQELLTEIGDSEEPGAINDVLPFVISSDHSVAAAAAAAVRKLLLATPPTDLPWLDADLRQRSPYVDEFFYDWHTLTPARISLLDRFGDNSVYLIGFASFHPNGYVREAAVRRLALITKGAEVPFLVLRLNDWVGPVRDAASAAIRARLKPDYCRSFIANLGLLSRLEIWGRADHRETMQAIQQLLRSGECRTTLVQSLKSSDRLARRQSFKLVLATAGSDLEQIAKMALADDDTLIRLWAAQKITPAFAGPTLEHFLGLMRQDSFMPVRREALRIAVKVNSANLIEELRAALMDQHQSLREESRFHLSKLEPLDFASFYRQHLATAEGRTVYPAISGLGETGNSQDAGLIVPYLSHRTSRIKCTAIKALARLDRAAHVDRFIEALQDEMPNVSREAVKVLMKQIASLDVARVWRLFKSATQIHVKTNALRLIEKSMKWESISYLVKALEETDESIVAYSRVSIQAWLDRFNRNFTTPTTEQLTQLRTALERSGKLMDEKMQEQLRFSMKGF